MPACATCGATNPDDARFCMRCGGSLATLQPMGERKVITALFCDLVGSTELADRLDPEDVDRLLRAYYVLAWRVFAEYGWDTPAGMVRGWLGRCLLDQGEVTAAVEHLQAGRHLATTLGLAALIVEIDANLARAGVEPLIA